MSFLENSLPFLNFIEHIIVIVFVGSDACMTNPYTVPFLLQEHTEESDGHLAFNSAE